MAKKRRKLSSSTYKEAYDSRNDGGVSRKDVIDWGKFSGDKKKFFKPSDGVNKINIIPYEIASENHPAVKAGKREIGDLDIALDVWVHRYIGPDQVDCLCPKKTYGKRCPICDQMKEFYDADKTDEAKAIKPSRRVFLNVQPVVKGEPQPMAIFSVSHYLFMKELIDEANECADGEDIVEFADIEEGSLVKFRTTEGDLKGVTFFKSFSFLEREEELDDDLIDEATPFDKYLIVPTAAQLEAALYGMEDDAAPTDSGKGTEGEEEESAADAKARKKKEKAEKKVEKAEDDPEASENKETESEIKERKRAEKKEAKAAEKKAAKEAEAAAKKAKKAEKKDVPEGDCPHGHTFGDDVDEHPQCDDCPNWDACMDAS